MLNAIVSDVLIPLSLALITFGIGLNITVHQIKEIWLKPKAFLIALSSQMIALPLIAFMIGWITNASPEVKVGLVVLAASPGGSTSGFLTYMLGGNTALSITLTTVNSLLTLFSIPVIVNLALDVFMHKTADIDLPVDITMKEIFLVTLIPAMLGVTVRYYFGDRISKVARLMKPTMMILLGVVFSIMIFGGTEERPNISLSQALYILPYCLALNFLCMGFGYFLPGWFKLGYQVQITTAIESGVHNTTLAFLITYTILGNFELSQPALVYALISFWTAIIFIYITRITTGRGTVKGDIQGLFRKK